jgi:hypothetical protein
MDANKEFHEIVIAFGNVLEQEDIEELTLVPSALPESLLPYPKSVIRHAIVQLLLKETSFDRRSILEEAYLYLDNFIPNQEYELFYPLDASIRAARGDSQADNSQEIAEIVSKNTELMQKVNTTIESIKNRTEQANEELKALRRISGLPNEKF